MLPLHTILHPSDFSERSEHAFRLACALARDYRAKLVVLHVKILPVAAYTEGGMLPPSPGTDEDLLAQLEQVRTEAPNLNLETRLEEGAPGPTILQVAQEIRADLIVLGTHGRTGLGRLLMGSVAEQVVRKATCPVVTVRMPVPTAEAEAVQVQPAAAPVPQAAGPTA
jgi:nucleotide-binding universal stress UspA family protein